MKNLLSALFIFAMGVVCAWAFFSATAETHALKESYDAELARITEEAQEATLFARQFTDCKTGQHCQIGKKEFVVITSGRAAVERIMNKCLSVEDAVEITGQILTVLGIEEKEETDERD